MTISHRFYCLATLAPFLIALPFGKRGGSQEQQVQAESWYATHTFYGFEDCLAVPENALSENDRVLTFGRGRPAEPATVGRMLLTAEAQKTFDSLGFLAVYRNETLWSEIGCYWALKGPDAPLRIAKLPEGSLGNMGLALYDLPTSAIAMGGAATELTDPEVAEYLRLLPTLVRAECAAEQPLYVGKRYGPVRGHEFVEFFVGAPHYADSDEGSVIDSIRICKFFLHNRRPVEQQEIFRSRYVLEHVDTAAPELTVSNWTETPERTLGFVSRDGGESWQRLTVDPGFEGILYAVRTLGSELPPEYERYHYTPH